jgi:hypothetical protein
MEQSFSLSRFHAKAETPENSLKGMPNENETELSQYVWIK